MTVVDEQVARAEEAFDGLTGRRPEGVWSAPGRVNLIGEHTDYNDGCVLPFAIHLRTAVAVGRRRDGWIRAVSLQQPGGEVAVPVGALAPGSVPGWAGYVAGVVWALRDAGFEVASGADMVVDGAVPPGSGLSSSAALECAVAFALAELAGAGPGGAGPNRGASWLDGLRPELARLAQRSENDFVGVPCGLMDQMAALAATEGHALYLDVRSGRAEQIPLDPARAGLALLVIDTHVRHAHAGGAYKDRRDACLEAARRLGVDTLRDVDPDGLDEALRRLADSPVLARRVRHVVTEQARTEEAARLLRAGRLEQLGPLLEASHRSLRHDFEVSVPELDAVVAAARAAGAAGARLTGGGFGGSVIALVPADRVESVSVAVAEAVSGGPAPTVMAVAPSGGARRDRP